MFPLLRSSRFLATGRARVTVSSLVPRFYTQAPAPAPTPASAPTPAPVNKRPARKAPIKLIFLVTITSFALLDLATRFMDKKTERKTSFTEQEYAESVKEGLRRKVRMFKAKELPGGVYLCPAPPVSVTSKAAYDSQVERLQQQLQARVIDLDALIAEQVADPDSRYGLLLESLAARGEAAVYPPGLFPVLVGMEFKDIRKLLVQEAGPDAAEVVYPTPIIIKNFPRTVKNATQFEQDVAFASKMVVFGRVDIDNDTFIEDQNLREFTQMAGYFDIVDKLVFVEKTIDAAVVEDIKA